MICFNYFVTQGAFDIAYHHYQFVKYALVTFIDEGGLCELKCICLPTHINGKL